MRSYFHLFDDVTACDPEGLDLPDDAAALEQALINVRSVAAETVCEGRLNLNHRIEVGNAEGQTVHTVYFRDAVEIQGCPCSARRSFIQPLPISPASA